MCGNRLILRETGQEVQGLSPDQTSSSHTEPVGCKTGPRFFSSVSCKHLCLLAVKLQHLGQSLKCGYSGTNEHTFREEQLRSILFNIADMRRTRAASSRHDGQQRRRAAASPRASAAAQNGRQRAREWIWSKNTDSGRLPRKVCNVLVV